MSWGFRPALQLTGGSDPGGYVRGFMSANLSHNQPFGSADYRDAQSLLFNYKFIDRPCRIFIILPIRYVNFESRAMQL